MPIEVELPDNSIAEFPDDMSMDQIRSVLAKKYRAPQATDFPSLQTQPQFETPAFQAAMLPKTSPEQTLLGADLPVVETTSDWSRPTLGEIKPQGTIGRFIEETAQAPIRVARLAKNEQGQWMPEAGPVDVQTGDEFNPRFNTALAAPAPTDYLAQLLPQGKVTDAAVGVRNAAANLINFFLSPQGAAMAGISHLPKAAQKTAAGYFAYDMAKHAPDSLAAGDEAFQRGDIAGAAEGWTSGIANLALSGLSAGHAFRTGAKVPLELENAMLEFERGIESKPLIEPDVAAPIRLGLPPRATPEMLPEVQRTRALADQAVREATQIIETPEPKALDLLKAQDVNVVVPELPRPEFRPGGGEAIGGKVSFNQPAESRMGLKKGPNAIQPTPAQPVRDVRQEPIPSQREVPAESAGRKADEGGGQVPPAEAKVPQDIEAALQARGYTDLMRQRLTPEEKARIAQEPLPTPEADAKTYWDMEDAIMAEANPTKKMEMLQSAWSQRELIKNRNPKNPGMPPERPAAEPGPVSGPLKSAIDSVENWQKKLREGPQSGQTQMGVPAAILDTALEVARLSLKAGKTVAEAIEAAIKHIRFNVREFNEKDIRALFESELGGREVSRGDQRGAAAATVGGPEVRTTPITETATTPEAVRTATLDDVYRIFEPAARTSTPIGRRAVNIVEAVRTGVSSKFRPINKLAQDIAKAYGLSRPKDIAGIMEQLKGSQGKGEADIYRFDRDVSDLVKGSEKDFNAYMFLRRATDRLTQDLRDVNQALAGGDVPTLNRRRVANYSLSQLRPKLAKLEEQLGPEKSAQFQQAAEAYQRHMDNALALQVESGRMSRRVYDAIKAGNQFYAPFKVMKYLEETSKPEGSGRKIDTVADFTKAMKGIEDPNFKLGDMLGAARQSLLLSRILADKNMAMRNVAELAQFDVEGLFIKKLKTGEEAPSGMEAVNVLEAGKQQRYAVAPEVANAIQLFGGNSGGIISKLLRYSSIPFRAGATALNLPFQVSNLMADVPRAALVSKYGLRGVSDMVRFPLDFVESLYSSIAGDVAGKKNKLFLDFLDSGVAGSTIQEYLTPEMLKFKEPTTVSRSRRLASSVLNVIPDFAKAIEQTSKVMGVKRAMRFEGAASGKELASRIPEAITEIRRFSGSPDFGRQGRFIENARLNLIYMFLNARIQGTIADIGRLVGRDGKIAAARMWMRILPAVGLPTAYLWYLNNDEQNREDYESRPEQEKQNYWMIPKQDEDGNPRYITTEEGERIRDYWRIPKRESSKWIANLTESALHFARSRDPEAAMEFGAQMLQEITPVNIQGETAQERLESVASSLNPAIKMPLELATGRDLYRHRPIMSERLRKASPEQQFTERTPEPFKKLADAMPDVAPEILRSPIMLENMTRNLTAGLLTQFMYRKPVRGRTAAENIPLLQRFQSIPMTDNAEFQSEMETLERQAADEQLARHRQANKIIEDSPGKPPAELVALALGNKSPDQVTPDDARLVRHLVDLWLSKENGATFKDRQAMALPVRQRALWVLNQIGSLSGEERQLKIQELARKRIYTEAVAAELAQLMETPR